MFKRKKKKFMQEISENIQLICEKLSFSFKIISFEPQASVEKKTPMYKWGSAPRSNMSVVH